MGGLARRVSYIKAFKLRSNSEVPVLMLDAGNLFSDEHYVSGLLPSWVIAKNKWVAKSYSVFHHDAANVTYSDLPYLAELLKKDGYQQRLSELPFIQRLVSANIFPIDQNLQAPAPYVIREIKLKRGQRGKALKIGIVGFSEVGPAKDYAGFRIQDPLHVAKQILPELKQKADFIIALAYMPQQSAQRLAEENSQIDVVIYARQINDLGEAQHWGRATVVNAYNQTKFLGELRIYVGSNGSIENQVNRYVALDDAIPDDAAATEIVTSAHTEFTQKQNEELNKPQSTADPTPSLLGLAGSLYVGVEACAKCHVREYDIWKNTGHAHAMATLERKHRQLDPDCVKCHVVGYERGGFQALYSTPQFANVQCEACHGPGRQHAESPAKGYGFMPTPVGCLQCHTPVNSPDFNFATYWPRVKH
jgi:hypothetical protein